jgi:peptidoglycan-associated lipoprotein
LGEIAHFKKEQKMKLTKFANLFMIAAALIFSAAGCRHRVQGVTPLPNAAKSGVSDIGEGTPISPGPGTGAEGTAIAANPPGSHEGWAEDTQTLQADTVYFDYDSSTVKTSEKSKVAAVADYLKANSANAAKIEGHCDERGTEEYNRALGERRALALREELVSLGVDPTRVDTISYGKDRPAVDGHNEAAWSKNRRGAFVLLTPPK